MTIIAFQTNDQLTAFLSLLVGQPCPIANRRTTGDPGGLGGRSSIGGYATVAAKTLGRFLVFTGGVSPMPLADKHVLDLTMDAFEELGGRATLKRRDH